MWGKRPTDNRESTGSNPVSGTNVRVAQQVEHCAENAGVGGSSPPLHTKPCGSFRVTPYVGGLVSTKRDRRGHG